MSEAWYLNDNNLLMDEDDVYVYLCRNDLATFVREAFRILEPETKYVHNWHIDVLCFNLMKVHRGELRKLDVNIGSRMLKTFIVNICYPAWVWLHEPWHKFISGSYVHSVALGVNRKRKKLVDSDWYGGLTEEPIAFIKETEELFISNHNGFFMAVSTNGKVTGEGADTLIGDDLLDVTAAFSPAERMRTRNWVENVFYDRVNTPKKAKRINVNHRVHKEDVSDLLRDKYDFPALIFQLEKTDDVIKNAIKYEDPRKLGDLLFPERFGEDERKDIVRSAYLFSCKWQQNPHTLEAGMLKETDFVYYDNLPASFEKRMIFCDTAQSEKVTSDYNAFSLWGKNEIGIFLIDSIRFKGDYSKQYDTLITFMHKHNCFNVNIENMATGPSLISALKKKYPAVTAWEVKGLKVSKLSKVQRMDLSLKYFGDGFVFFPNMHHNFMKDFIAEHLGFTREGSLTGNDDWVDTTTMAVLKFLFTKKGTVKYA